MITKFGKFCRNLRMDRNEILKDMADKLGVKSSFLSAVELGKKNVPSNWFEEIAKKYSLSEGARSELAEAIKLSANSIKIDLKSKSDFDREVALSFARSFGNLTDEDKENLKRILNREDN